MKIIVLLLAFIIAGSMSANEVSAQVSPLESARTRVDPNATVMQRVEAFRVPATRTDEVNRMGAFVWGYMMGARTGPLETASVACFGSWTIGQAGEWLLQYWEKTPEIWDQHWMEAAAERILGRLQSPDGC